MLRQGIREISALQKYPIGYRFAEKGGIGDRVFRYCRAIAALTEKWGVGNNDFQREQNTAVVAYAGDQDITLVLGTAAKDQFKDGYLNVWVDPLIAPAQLLLKIKGNEASDGTNTVIHLEEPLLYDTPLATFTELYENIYNSCDNLRGLDFQSRIPIVCVPLVPVTIDYFFWGLTWGPCVGVGYKGGLGALANEKDVYFWGDGSIASIKDIGDNSGEQVGATTTGQQRAGFMMGRTETAVDTPTDALTYMLQLAP